MNNLIKRIKRAAFGFRNFGNYRIRALLYAGKPNWNPLAAVTPLQYPKCRLWVMDGDGTNKQEIADTWSRPVWNPH